MGNRAKITAKFNSSANLAGFACGKLRGWLEEHGATDIEVRLDFEKPKETKNQ